MWGRTTCVSKETSSWHRVHTERATADGSEHGSEDSWRRVLVICGHELELASLRIDVELLAIVLPALLGLARGNHAQWKGRQGLRHGLVHVPP